MVEVEERKLYIPGQEALSNLPRLIEESVRETEDLQRQFTGFKPGMDILSWHEKTDRFRYVYKEAQRIKRGIRKPRYYKRFHHDFAEAVFQDIAYSVCALGCDDSRVVLSPEKTSKFWTMLYPNKEIVPLPYGQVTLKNIYVPDGILVDKSKNFVSKLYEYSLPLMNEENLEKQLRTIRIPHRRFPGLFAQASVGLVTPITFPLPKMEGEREGIEFLQLPITRVQFRRFIGDLYNRMR